MSIVSSPRTSRRAAIAALLAATLLATAVPALAAPYQLDSRRGRDLVLILPNRGKVLVVPGSANGPDPERVRRLSIADLGLQREDSDYDFRPRAVGSGDVDGDGHADLAVLGVSPDFDGRAVVTIVPGGPDGLRYRRSYRVDPGDDKQYLGTAMHVADVDRDGFDDVVASHWTSRDPGMPPLEPARDAFASVMIMWGSPSGVRGSDTTTFLAPTAEGYPTTALLIGSGNVLGDRRTELVVAEPGQIAYNDYPGTPGHLQVCTVEPHRDVTCGDTLETAAGVTDLVVDDFVGDRRADVVFGQPQAYTRRGGAVWVHRSAEDRLAPASQLTQDSPGVPGTDESGDEFGMALAAADLDDDGKADLAVGAPGEDNDDGRVALLYGHRDGLGATSRDVLVSQDTRGVPGRAEPNDRFGAEVSLLDVDGNAVADLLVGAPAEDSNHGLVTFVRSTRAGLLDPRSGSGVIRGEDLGYEYDQRRRWLALGSYIGR